MLPHAPQLCTVSCEWGANGSRCRLHLRSACGMRKHRSPVGVLLSLRYTSVDTDTDTDAGPDADGTVGDAGCPHLPCAAGVRAVRHHM